MSWLLTQFGWMKDEVYSQEIGQMNAEVDDEM